MNDVIERIVKQLRINNLSFTSKPIVIGGMAMEFYGIRKSGTDIDLVITDKDYKMLAQKYPEQRKDIYGDLGVVIGPFEIWRSIALLDYDFYQRQSIIQGPVGIVDIDRLLFMRVSAMEVKKYMDDLMMMKEFYYTKYRNQEFLQEAEKHIPTYDKKNGIVFGGNYQDN